MRRWARSSAAVAAAVIGLGIGLASPVALAEVEVEAPSGWVKTPGPELTSVRARAQEAGYRLSAAYRTPEEDGFRESLWVLHAPTALDLADTENPERALERLSVAMARILGREAVPEPLEQELGAGSDGRFFRAKWEIDEVRHEALLASAGAERAVVIMRAQAREYSLYRGVFDSVAEGLSGIEAPVPPFARGVWRWGSAILWVGVALGLHMLMLGFADRRGDHRGAARRASALVLLLTLFGGVFTFLVLGDAGPSLDLAKTSAAAVATEVVAWGIGASGLLLGLAYLLDEGERVQSAPGTGTYAAVPSAPPVSVPASGSAPASGSVPASGSAPASAASASTPAPVEREGRPNLEKLDHDAMQTRPHRSLEQQLLEAERRAGRRTGEETGVDEDTDLPTRRVRRGRRGPPQPPRELS